MIRCALDEDGCIDLQAVLRIMNQISQEQAWALAYELAALMQRMWPAGNNCAIVESLAQIYIHRDGFIHEKSLWTMMGLDQEAKTKTASTASSRTNTSATMQVDINTSTTTTTTTINNTNTKNNADADKKTHDINHLQNGLKQRKPAPSTTTTNTNAATAATANLPPSPPITPELSDELLRRRKASSEAELVSSLGMALFWALDYGIPDDEERKLNIAMEYLIVQSQKEMSLAELEHICIKRLPVDKKSQADMHYRQVCKSLLQDTIELSIFLDKIYTATMALSSVDGHHYQLQQLQAAISNNGANNNESKLDGTGGVGGVVGGEPDYLKIAQQLANEKNTSADRTVEQQNQIKSKHCRDNLITAAYRDHHYVDDDHLSDLGLPLASLRALKINDWARLWMQVIRELRQRGKIVVT